MNRTEEIFEVKMTKNFPKLMTDTKTVPAEAPGNSVFSYGSWQSLHSFYETISLNF